MLDQPAERATEPNPRAIARTIALAVAGLVIGAVIATLGVTTLMSLWWEVMWT